MSNIDPARPPLAAIFGLAGEALTEEEKRFFAAANPLGFILFARNCQDPAQVKNLTRSLCDVAGRDVPVLIDQEGGRVQRLKPPHWRQYPPARQFGEPADEDALAATVTAIGQDLIDLGINVNCAPVLDVRFPETHAAIGDRAFSDDPHVVASLGAASCRAYLESGVIPVIKHMPGLGRADLDTHHDLPAVAATVREMEGADFLPFRDVSRLDIAGAVWGMVSHALYSDIDPQTPASCSRPVIEGAIRKAIGFDGLLLSDDLSMGALEQYGDTAARAQKVLAAGCDIALHCNGDLAEMTRIAAGVPMMTSAAIVRYNRSVTRMKDMRP